MRLCYIFIGPIYLLRLLNSNKEYEYQSHTIFIHNDSDRRITIFRTHTVSAINPCKNTCIFIFYSPRMVEDTD